MALFWMWYEFTGAMLFVSLLTGLMLESMNEARAVAPGNLASCDPLQEPPLDKNSR